MKNLLLTTCVFILCLSFSCTQTRQISKSDTSKKTPDFELSKSTIENECEEYGIKWLDANTAFSMNKNPEQARKLFFDFYTDWCFPCKQMDSTTFQNPDIVHYLNDNYYPVKFNGESPDSVFYNGQKYIFVELGKHGFHEFVYEILEGDMAYPSMVIMDEQSRKIEVIQGYTDEGILLKKLQYFNENHFMRISFSEFERGMVR